MAVTIIKSYNSDNQAEVTADHELKVTGNITTNNSSVGTNGDPAPTDATLIGGVDPNGDLRPLEINDEGRLQVDAGQIFGIQDLQILYNEVSGIAVGIETTINSYTAPIGKTSYLLSILSSGGNRGTYNIYNNGSLFDRQYSNVTVLTANFDYKTGSGSVPGMVIPVGNTIDVKIVNAGSSTADYNARFMILEVT